MRSRLLTTLLAAVIVVGGLNVAAYAATGGKFILGKSNTANKTTKLKNTGNGPALKLAPKAGKPPLAVTNSKKVVKLNADKVDGKDAAALSTRSAVYSVPAIASSSRFRIGIPSTPGTYQVDYSIATSTSTPGVTINCYWNTTFEGSVTVTGVNYGGAYSSFSTSSGSATVLSSGTDDWLECFTESGTAATTPGFSQIVVTPINAIDFKTGAVHPRPSPGSKTGPGLG